MHVSALLSPNSQNTAWALPVHCRSFTPYSNQSKYNSDLLISEVHSCADHHKKRSSLAAARLVVIECQ